MTTVAVDTDTGMSRTDTETPSLSQNQPHLKNPALKGDYYSTLF